VESTFFKKGLTVEEELFGKRWETSRLGRVIRNCNGEDEYDQSTLYTCMKMP
jgi:hypothetical protein